MGLRVASSLTTGSAGCEVFCARFKFGVDDPIKQTRRVRLSGRHLVKKFLVSASSSCTVTRQTAQFSPAMAAQAERGQFADSKSSSSASSSSASSPSTSGRWVKHLEVESIIKNLQQGNGASLVDFMHFTDAIPSGCLISDSTNSLSSLPPHPQPLSITAISHPSTASRSTPQAATVVRVAHPGAAGAHSEAASAKAYPHCHSLPCGKFEVPFLAVELGLADRAVLPIENSVGGSIHKTYDLMLRHRLHIVGEVKLAVSHCLMAMPGTRKEDLTRVLSHPQALAQCERNLSDLGVKAEAVNDTAAAAHFVGANAVPDTAAIARSQAASLYGLSILESDFQDYASNATRFLMMAREPVLPAGGSDRKLKTSIVFALQNESDNLFRALSAFAMREINLTKIESRPAQMRKPLHEQVDDEADASRGIAGKHRSTISKCFECLYFMDFEASMAERQAQNALKELEEFCSFLRVLGCYPLEDDDHNH